MKKIEITLKEMAIYVLRRWFLVLAVAAIVAFAYNVYSNNKAEQAQAQYQAEQAAYEKALVTYEKETELAKKKVENIEAQIDNIQDYLDNAIRMRVNPNDYTISSITLDFDSSESNTILNRVTNHYLQLAQDAPLETILAPVVPEETNFSYLKEVVTFRRTDNDILTISTIGDEEINPQLVTKAILDYLVSKKELVTATAGEHTFTVMNSGLQRGSDTSLINVRNTQENRIVALNRQLNELKVPKPDAPYKPESSTSLLPGIIGGLVAGILVALICYLLFLPLQYGKQAQKQLGIRYLGSIKKTGEKLENVDLVAANIAEATDNSQSVLVLGSSNRNAPDDVVQAIQKTDALQDVKLLSGNNVLNTPETVKALGEADGVILALEQYHSRIRNVWADVERIAQTGKPILGYIVQ